MMFGDANPGGILMGIVNVTGNPGDPGDIAVDLLAGVMYVADDDGNWREIGGDVRLSSKLINLTREEIMSPETKLDLITQAQEMERDMRSHAVMRHGTNVVRLRSGDDGIKVYINGKLKMTISDTGK